MQTRESKSKKTILLVEDEAIIAMAESMALRRFGYEVATANSGREAVQAATGPDRVDIVLMDIDLGEGIDGTEAARQILAARSVPIVFLTSHSEREMVERVRGITRYGYVIKNSGNFVLQSSIEMALELFEAHERVRESESRQRALMQTIPDLIWLKDAEGVYLSCNRTFEEFFGVGEADIIGKTDYDFMEKGQADLSRANDGKAVSVGHSRVDEEWITAAGDGRRALLETIRTPLCGSGGRLIGVLSIGREITERKRVESSLSESQRAMTTLLGNLQGMAYRCLDDKDWTMEFVSQGSLALTGYQPDDLVENRRISFGDVIHPEDRFAVARDIAEAIEQERPFELVYRIVCADGAVKWVEDRGCTVFAGEGPRRVLEGFVADVTERKRGEEIQSSRLSLMTFAQTHTLAELLRATLDQAEALTASQIGFFHFVDEDQKTLSLQAWSTNTVLNMCTAEGAGRHYPVDKAGVWVDCLRERRPVVHNDYASLQHRKGLPPGHAKVVRELVVPVMRGERVEAVLGVGNKPSDYTEYDVQTISTLADLAWEIGEIKRAQEAVKVSEEKFSSIVSQAIDAIALVDAYTGHFVEFNEAAHDGLGYTRFEFSRMNIADIQAEHTQEEILANIGRIRTHGSAEFETSHRHRSGELRVVHVRARQLTLHERSLIAAVWTDITDRKAHERQMERWCSTTSSTTRGPARGGRGPRRAG